MKTLTISELRSKLSQNLLNEDLEITANCTTIGYFTYKPTYELTKNKLDFIIDEIQKLSERVGVIEKAVVPEEEHFCETCKNLGAKKRDVIIDFEPATMWLCDNCYIKYQETNL